MNKKTFRQNDLDWLIMVSVSIFITISGQAFLLYFLIYEMVRGFADLNMNIPMFITIVVSGILFLFTVFLMSLFSFGWNIQIDDTKIWNKGDLLTRERSKIQIGTEVYFSEIISINIDYSHLNSAGKIVRHYHRYPYRYSHKNKFLVLSTSSDEKRFIISFFNDLTIMEIIDEIIKRCEICSAPYDGRTSYEILYGDGKNND